MSDLENFNDKLIVITRPLEEARKLSRILATHRIHYLIEPLFKVKKNFLKPDKSVFSNIQALIITSANASETIIKLALDKNIKIFAVGHKTADQLVECGYKNIFYSPQKTAYSLKELLLKELDPKLGKLIYFCGTVITLDFEAELKKEGFKVQKVIAYKTIEINSFSDDFMQKLLAKKIGQILIYSKNSGRIFLELFKKTLKDNNLSESDIGLIKLNCFSENIINECNNLIKKLKLNCIIVEGFEEIRPKLFET